MPSSVRITLLVFARRSFGKDRLIGSVPVEVVPIAQGAVISSVDRSAHTLIRSQLPVSELSADQ